MPDWIADNGLALITREARHKKLTAHYRFGQSLKSSAVTNEIRSHRYHNVNWDADVTRDRQ